MEGRSWRAGRDLILAIIDGYRRHRSGRNAALIGYYAFISIFPLFLVFTTVLGFVLESNKELQDTIVDSVLTKLPIIGPTLASNELQGNTFALITGLGLALWSGMKAFVGVQWALDDIHEIPMEDRVGFVGTRVRALGAIAVLGLGQIGATAVSAVAGQAQGQSQRLLLIAGAAIINTLLLWVTYQVMCSERSTWRSLLPGAVVAGVAFTVLQLVGTTFVSRSIGRAESVYGTFAAVIALLAWLSLHANVMVVGAELNRALKVSRR